MTPSDKANMIEPPKLTRIEALMKRLETLPERIGHEPITRRDFEAVTVEARQLILDLLGLSEKLKGESIYEAHMKRITAAYGEEGHDLKEAIRFVKRWIPDCWPATESGQVPFARALVESLILSAEKHLELYPVPVEPKS